MKTTEPIRWNSNREVYADPRNFPALWTPTQTHVWEKGVFTVPKETPEERVGFVAHRYVNKFGEVLEAKGFQVLKIEGPTRDDGLIARQTVDPDRKRYVMWAKVRRRPVTEHYDVPDEMVPALQEAGLKLME